MFSCGSLALWRAVRRLSLRGLRSARDPAFGRGRCEAPRGVPGLRYPGAACETRMRAGPGSALLVLGTRELGCGASTRTPFASSGNDRCTSPHSSRSGEAVARKLSLVTQALTLGSGEAR